MVSNQISFTAPKIGNLKCESGKDQSFYWDSKTPSLGIRVTANGAKSYIFQTWFTNKAMRITIGNIETWSIPKAQAEARRLKVLTDQGVDPRVERAKIDATLVASQAKCIQGLLVWDEYIKERTPKWGERHLSDHWLMVKEGGKKVTQGSRKGRPQITQDGILRTLLSLPISEINRETILKWIKKEVNIRPTRVRLALALLKAFISWTNYETKYKGIIDKDCCDGLTRELPPKKVKEDCLQKEQLCLWFKGLDTISNPTIRSYLAILLLTGARRGELARLKWTDIDHQWNIVTIRDKVEGTRKIPLTPYVAMLIGQLPRINQFVFASPAAKRRYIAEPRIAHNQGLDKVGLPNLTINGLRRSFATIGQWIVGCPVGIVAQIMGQKPTAIAEKHYIKRSISLLRQWHCTIEKFILDEAGIFQPEESRTLKIVNSQ